MKLELFSANASGNVTLFVTSPVSRKEYGLYAQKLLANPSLGGEQVAYIIQESNPRWDGKFEMCGMEFCCNATRSFGLKLALEEEKNQGHRTMPSVLRICASGMDQILTVAANTKTMETSVLLPPPLSLSKKSIKLGSNFINATVVELEGIMHVVLMDIPYDNTIVDVIRHIVMKDYNPMAVGVLFYNQISQSMFPAVYVRDVDTTYLEGSCGSGTAALAAALSYEKTDGTHYYSFQQPVGSLSSSVVKKDGHLVSVSVEGPIILSPSITVEI